MVTEFKQGKYYRLKRNIKVRQSDRYPTDHYVSFKTDGGEITSLLNHWMSEFLDKKPRLCLASSSFNVAKFRGILNGYWGYDSRFFEEWKPDMAIQIGGEIWL